LIIQSRAVGFGAFSYRNEIFGRTFFQRQKDLLDGNLLSIRCGRFWHPHRGKKNHNASGILMLNNRFSFGKIKRLCVSQNSSKICWSPSGNVIEKAEWSHRTIDETVFKNWLQVGPNRWKSWNYFCENLLIHFGDYQDAMLPGTLFFFFFERLSLRWIQKCISSPWKVVQKVAESLEGKIKSENQQNFSGWKDSFVRSIGWREYMRGILLAKMPDFAEMNFFGHEGKATRMVLDWGTKWKKKMLSHLRLPNL